MEKEKSLLFSQSPLCPIAADVISDGESIYLYLYDLDFETQRLIAHCACWVKNLMEAPLVFDEKKIQGNGQPALPVAYCDEMDLEEWKEEDLEIVWNPAGDMAGLYHQGDLVCVLPYSKKENGCGFAKYAKENSVVAWKMAEGALFIPQIEAGKTFWSQEFNLTWKEYNTSYFEDLVSMFQKANQCFDLHKDEFPTRLLVTFEGNERCYGATIGCGMFFMPQAHECYEDWQKEGKGEFIFCYRPGSLTNEELMEVYSQIAGLCEVPWHTISCIGHGHTLDMKLKDHHHAMIIDDDFMKEPLSFRIKKQGVHMLWIIAITDKEFEDAHDVNKREALIQQLIEDRRYEL
ncbi:suppressor of fused domain protein [[Eubacterium] hominis]|uniref:suppressor of fused domain protein n=1 Tax=[Eubacterium] hominis TaxID=2764325 RepID=UPI003A4E5C20